MTVQTWVFWCSLYVLLLNPLTTIASDNASELAKQRILFQQAKNAFETNQIPRFRNLQSQLNGYALQPYLDYLYLRHRLSQTNPATIQQFLNENQGTFYAQLLRKSWLDKLAQNKQWQTFLTTYKPPQSIKDTIVLVCSKHSLPHTATNKHLKISPHCGYLQNRNLAHVIVRLNFGKIKAY
ncbi:MAG: hypothetical protein Q9N32_00620 [Gammaproteobacteria bacterium]|nr:hypothetical protein [Gammaproteobacteria bacterium]